VRERKPTKTWERTRLQNLIRHKSGRYYARAFAGGKQVWKSLKTSHFSVAQARLAELGSVIRDMGMGITLTGTIGRTIMDIRPMVITRDPLSTGTTGIAITATTVIIVTTVIGIN
jgi:hypothetical protein